MVLMALIHITSMVVHEGIIGCGILAYSTMGVGKYVICDFFHNVLANSSYLSFFTYITLCFLCRF
jgi:hypothetical protein